MKTRVCVQVDVHAVRDHCFWGFLQIKRRKNAPTLSPTPATPLSAASENNGVLTAHKPSDVSGFSALMFLDEADETCRTSESSLEASGASINTPTHTNTSIIRFQGFCRDDENQTDSISAPRSTNCCWFLSITSGCNRSYRGPSSTPAPPELSTGTRTTDCSESKISE